MPENKAIKQEQGRRNFRIDDVIPLNDEKLTPEEYEVCKHQVGIRSRQNSMLRQMVGRDIFPSEGSEGASVEMIKGLEALDAKLNYLIGVNMLNDANHSHLKERPVNLSITGASFVSRTPYAVGDAIRLTMMLPVFPPTILELVGTVKRVNSDKNGLCRVALEFHYRCDDEEDAVSQYVFRRHREMIRAEAKRRERVA